MAIAYDIKLKDDGDIYVDPVTRDIVIAPSDLRHVEDIFLSAPGFIKEFPLCGWDPYSKLNARLSRTELIQSATIQLIADGYAVRAIDFDIVNGTIVWKTFDVIRQ